MSTSVSVITELNMLRYAPELVAWLAGVVLAVIMVRRGGGKAEKLLLVGCSLMFAAKLATPLLYELVQGLLSEQDIGNVAIAQSMGLIVSQPLFTLSLAGLICLFYAFWVKFWAKKQEST
ncbi:hypothetical protein ACFLYR_03015 [Chloroflexota bacterium]